MGVSLLLGLAGLASILGDEADASCQVGLDIHLRQPGVVVLKKGVLLWIFGHGKVGGLLWLKARLSLCELIHQLRNSLIHHSHQSGTEFIHKFNFVKTLFNIFSR